MQEGHWQSETKWRLYMQEKHEDDDYKPMQKERVYPDYPIRTYHQTSHDFAEEWSEQLLALESQDYSAVSLPASKYY